MHVHCGGAAFLPNTQNYCSPRPLLRHDDSHLKMSSDAEQEGIDLFQEPTDFYEPEKQATFASHQLLSGKELKVRLVGHNPLWVRVLATTALPKQSTGLPIIIDISFQSSISFPESFSKPSSSLTLRLTASRRIKHVH